MPRSKWFAGPLGAGSLVLLAAISSADGDVFAESQPVAGAAEAILDAAGIRGGLVVLLGCGDGQLIAELGQREGLVVQGLDADAEAVSRVRELLRARGLSGRLSADTYDGSRLPYADNLVNLLVSSGGDRVSADEAMRVLAPGGARCLRRDGRWEVAIKPRPAEIDEWTHFLHGANGNPVAHDDQVGPPRRVQWIAEPQHARSHEHIPSIAAVVSSGGRVFYIADQAEIASIKAAPRWQLVARDAFNGIALWTKPVPTWFPHLCNWGNTPPQLERKLVADGRRVYVALGYHAPLSALDAATGETIRSFESTLGTEEVLYDDGILVAVVREVTRERVAELDAWAQLVLEQGSPLDRRESAEPRVNRFRSIESDAPLTLLAIDAETGRLLWKRTGEATARLKPLSVCSQDGRVFYQNGNEAICLEQGTGRELWSVATDPLRLVENGVVLCAGGETVTARAADTGKVIWKQPTLLTETRDVFVAGGAVWLGGFKPCEGKRGPSWGPYFATQLALADGKLLRHVEPENPGHHHRCFQNKATDRFILGGRRGIEFVDLQSGEVLWNSWLRGVCKYGVMPCNGLVYVPPHACGCYIQAKLTGFYALAAADAGAGREARLRAAEVAAANPAVAAGSGSSSLKAGLETGPAYAAASTPATSANAPADWPTYRHDAQRSGGTPASVPAKLRVAWQREIGGRLTAPTIAEGRVFVSSIDRHTVHSLDAAAGAPQWSYTAGARVDTPPTAHAGRVLFGSRDGRLVSLRAADGALAWQLRPAREPRYVVAHGQLESAVPVGGVLIQGGEACFTAGRSSYLDGGIDLYRVVPDTGKVLSATRIYSPDAETDRQPPQSAPYAMPGALADILSADEEHIYLRDAVFNSQGQAQAQSEGLPHLFTLTGFLDDSEAHRSYWIFGTRCSLSTGCSGRDKDLLYGRLLSFDNSTVYGYGRKQVHWSNQLEDGPYRLFAVDRATGEARWEVPLGIHVRAMVLAGRVLFAAGPQLVRPSTGSGASPVGEARLLALSADAGQPLAEVALPAPPCFDGMAAAGGRLYLSLEDGRVVGLE